MFRKLFVSGTSACFEFVNGDPYYSPKNYTVLLNGEPIGAEKSTNVFSVFNLKPSTRYSVTTTADNCKMIFTTCDESGVVDVREIGARGDGVTDDTYYLQMAIYSCPKNGRVVIPEGVYLTRPLVLKGDITIEIKKGATLLGNVVEENYPFIPACGERGGKEEVLASWEGQPFDCHQSLVSAYRQSNIKIVGEGTINGNANNSTWWKTPEGRKVARPRLMFLNKCKDIVMHGVTCKNSPSWNLHPFFSKNLKFLDLKLRNPLNAPSSDGLVPESCDGVEIIGCNFSVGDDCCAVKSGKPYMGRTYKTPASDCVLRNNLFENGRGAVVLGSEMSGGVKKIRVSQCVIRHTDRGFYIKTRRGAGKHGIIDGVTVENVVMESVITPFAVNMYCRCGADGQSEYVRSRDPNTPVDDGTPYLGRIAFRDAVCSNCECMAGYFDGLVEQPIGEIALENVSFSFREDAKAYEPALLDGVEKYCRQGIYADNVERLVLKNVTFDGLDGERIIRKNCGEIVEDFSE